MEAGNYTREGKYPTLRYVSSDNIITPRSRLVIEAVYEPMDARLTDIFTVRRNATNPKDPTEFDAVADTVHGQ